MAKIYQRTLANSTTEKCLILDPREALIYPFNIGNDWLEARLGFFFSTTGTAGDNVTSVAESITTDNPANSFAIGLKNNNAALPRAAGSIFWGAAPGSNTGTISAVAQVTSSNWSWSGYTVLADGTTQTNSASFWGNFTCNPQVASTTSYAAFFGLKFNIANRGQANQTVAIQMANIAAGTDVSLAALRTYVTGFTGLQGAATMAASPWNDGVSAKPIPDAIFVRIPQTNNRLRISAMMIEKFA